MSTRNISFNIFWAIAALLGMDLYVFFVLRKSIASSKGKRIFYAVYFISVVIAYIGLYFLYNNFVIKPLQASLMPNLFVGFFFSFFVFKLLLIVFFLFEDIGRLVKLIFLVAVQLFQGEKVSTSPVNRRKFIRKAGLFVAAIPFTSMLYGITKGKYNFKVNHIKLSFPNLPKSFEGYKIVQISDIHSGSFDEQEAILDGVDLINKQEADLILFTGDLVNNDSREIVPFINDFKKLRATDGVFSILGNHDYGDYKKWPSEKEKEKNMDLLYEYQKQMDFKLLNNESESIKRGGEEIGIYGVENWGNPPFPQRGDIDKALSGNENIDFKILMSHDPTHWNKKVLEHPTHFDLTLSGHTHGMQFGVEIPGFKWSPIKYIYPQWAGLYEKSKQYLYVNRGFGFLGFPGRVGIWPEVTVIELSRKT